MTNQELQQLAREYANKHLTSGCFNVNGEPRVDVRDLAYFYETLLSDIAKTHCIVSREKVMQQYHEDKAAYDRNSGDCGYFGGYWDGRVDVYEAVFGAELFETNKPTEQ